MSSPLPWPVLDHLVVAAADLASGEAFLRERLGTPLHPGGKHASMGTHNGLLRLSAHSHLELIAIDPSAPPPARARWFGLDDPEVQARISRRPRLLHWVARGHDPTGEVLTMGRDGLEWRITVPADGRLPGDGLVPSLIEWLGAEHPAARLPDSGLALMKLEGFHPRPEEIHAALAALRLDRHIAIYPAEAGDTPSLVAYIRTPGGLCELD